MMEEARPFRAASLYSPRRLAKNRLDEKSSLQITPAVRIGFAHPKGGRFKTSTALACGLGLLLGPAPETSFGLAQTTSPLRYCGEGCGSFEVGSGLEPLNSLLLYSIPLKRRNPCI